jgi:hypothetical protein
MIGAAGNLRWTPQGSPEEELVAKPSLPLARG